MQGGHNNMIVILTIKQKKQLWRKQAINHNLQELSSTTSNFSTQAFSTGPYCIVTGAFLPHIS